MTLGAIKTIQVKFCESRLKMGREKEKQEYLRFWSNYSKNGNGRRPATTHPLRFKSQCHVFSLQEKIKSKTETRTISNACSYSNVLGIHGESNRTEKFLS